MSSRRALIGLAIGAAAGLLIAGHELFTARGSSSLRLPPEDVALVNQRPLLRSDFVVQTEALTGKRFSDATLAERRRVLDDMVREELFVQRGIEMEFFATDADTRNALVSAVEQQVVAEVAFAPPDEAALRAFHAANSERFATRGTMAVELWSRGLDPAADEAALRKALARIRQLDGADAAPALVAAGLSLDARSLPKDELYVVAQRQLGAKLFDAARLLAPGALSEPIVAEGRVHVLRVLRHAPPRPRAFETVRAEVQSAWTEQEGERRKQATLDYLRGRAEIRLAPPYDQPAANDAR